MPRQAGAAVGRLARVWRCCPWLSGLFPKLVRRTMRHKGFILTVLLLAMAGVAALSLPRIVRAVNYGREVPILMYHAIEKGGGLSVWQVSASEFERQMDDLKADGRKAILPDDIWRASRGLYLLPRKPVVITFDDGYEGVLKYAEPVLAAHGFRAICYVIVGRLAGEGLERGAFEWGPLLSTNEVAAMAARGVVSFGSHSLTHQRVPAALAQEAYESRHVLRRLTGVKTRSYCYPHGLHRYGFMQDALRVAKFRTALICDDRLYRFGVETNLLAIPRVSVYGGNHSFHIEKAMLDGGQAEATVVNDGTAMPVRCMLRDKATGRRFLSEGAPVRVGRGHRAKGKRAVFRWSSLPAGLDAAKLEAVVCEQNALFTYGSPALVYNQQIPIHDQSRTEP